jgi:hypothetical protein
MRFTAPDRTDLIISMTLAEIFLLLLFVVWYGHTAIIRHDPEARIKEQLARLERENERLSRELKQANEQITDLKTRLDWWHKNFPAVVEGSSGEEARQAASRGHPKCQDNNILIHGSVCYGQVSMTWIAESAGLSKRLVESGHAEPRVGTTISGAGSVQSILSAIREYYSSNGTDGIQCRFDYRLSYGSDSDYRYARQQLFERVFYPAGGITQCGKPRSVRPSR